ncbi:malate dehydrogenase (NAD) [Roseiarcus fermentans]|uniref:Malate dehydrogenase (NAD) n=1 Tax=Roseiarcus fermentans TaxID=1473586 RepID=A0A366FPV1_9HYPH|nr:malate dehydrogenase [Roseiarcus fermentans]RBP16070.1 malate dehydrogenase (NAD) [Roseiarcus fermentans]
MSVVTAADVEKASGVLTVGQRDVITPLAADRAKELGIKIERSSQPSPAKPPPVDLSSKPPRRGAAPVVLNAPTSTLSGALYRRGAGVPPALQVDNLDAAAPADPRPAAGVIGAGHVGAMTALRLAETSLFSRVTLVDIVPGLAAGLALDMGHSASLRGFTTRIEGSAELSALAGADYIVVTAGRPRQPGMSRTDLTGVNGSIVTAVAQGIRLYAPDSVVVVVTNPLEEMTHLTARTTGFPPQRVIGMAGVLDSARFCSLVALTGVARPQDVSAIALGSHGPEMVIPMSQATVNGRPLEEALPADQIDAIVERARDSGAEVVKLLQKGSAYFAPAESAAAMVIDMVRESSRVQAACVQSSGAYGLEDTRVGLPVRLGRRGVREIVALALTASERTALAKAASSIAARVREMG